MTITETTPVGQLVAENPRLASNLERWGLDYCCSARASLAEACTRKGLSLEAVLEDLRDTPQDSPLVWTSLSELCRQIVERHHGYLRRELPVLLSQLQRVVQAHAPNHPQLWQLQQVFLAFEAELTCHMAKEEMGLFPSLERLEQTPAEARGEVCLDPVFGMLEEEHEQAGQDLAQMRQLTEGFTPPTDACPTYRSLLVGLDALEQDMHRHIHAENYVLFPAAQRLLGRSS